MKRLTPFGGLSFYLPECQRRISQARLSDHGLASLPEYRIHWHLKRKCALQHIPLCSKWVDFLSFIMDVGLRPTPFHRLKCLDITVGYLNDPRIIQWAARPTRCRYCRTCKGCEIRECTRHRLPKTRCKCRG